MQPDIEAWDPWHPRDIAARMQCADFPWFVAGGWAIDLFLGTRTRDHEDLEIAVASSFFETLPPRFPEFDFWIPQGERKLGRMSTETLAGESNQTWAYERAAQVWRFRRVPRAAGRRHLDLPTGHVDPAAVPGGFRRVGGRDPVPAA
jgi:hypothetical protein